MATTTDRSVDARMEALERQNRWMRRIGTLALTVLGAAVWLGQTGGVPQSLEARQFLLRDAHGRTRAVLNTTNDRVAFALYDTLGAHRVVLDIDDDGAPWVRLLDPNGKVRVSLTQQKTGAVLFSMADGGGRIRTMLGTRKDGAPYLSLMDALSLERLQLTLRSGGGPHVALADTNSNERIVMDLDDEGFARLTIRDRTRTRAVLGKTHIAEMKRGRVQFLPPASLVFYDEDGELVFAEP